MSEKISNGYKEMIFLCAGRMIYRKGFLFLLDALSEISMGIPFKCNIVGNGPEWNKINKKVSKDTNLKERVFLTGMIPYSEMDCQYSMADVFIMPSIREASGAVLLEAMAHGLPVITINKFGGKLVIDEETGWFYSGTDKRSYLDDLKKIIIECISKPDEVARKGENAKKKAENFTWDKKLSQYYELYNLVLKE